MQLRQGILTALVTPVDLKCSDISFFTLGRTAGRHDERMSVLAQCLAMP
jgi:hypothetical protein